MNDAREWHVITIRQEEIGSSTTHTVSGCSRELALECEGLEFDPSAEQIDSTATGGIVWMIIVDDPDADPDWELNREPEYDVAVSEAYSPEDCPICILAGVQ
jgi:hypothetical protein